MNLRLSISVLVLVLGHILSFGDDFDRRTADVVILQLKPVQRELGITEAQRAKMNKAADAHRAKLASYEKELQASKGKPERSRIISYYIELKQQVLNDLTPQQIKRLRELSLQREGLVGLADQSVARRVGLSDGQLKKLRDDLTSGEKEAKSATEQTAKPIVAKYKALKPKNQDEAQALHQKFQKELRSALRPKLSAIERKNKAEILALLTGPQKSAWKALQGKTFTILKQ